MQPNDATQDHRKRFHSAFSGFVRHKLSQNPKRKFSFSELSKSYEEETGIKTTRQAKQKALKRIKGIVLERREQLWVSMLYHRNPTDENATNATPSTIKKGEISMDGYDGGLHQTIEPDKSNIIHSSHRWFFSIGYAGKQPTEGAKIKPFGRYKTAIQAIHEFKDMTIVAFRNKINIWIHNPEGKLTQNQKIEARTRAYTSIKAFERQYGITIKGDLKGEILNSHHVVEHKELNEALKPILRGREEEIKEVLGSGVCNTSHKGKIEHEGTNELTAFEVAKNLEYLCTKFPTHFSQLAQENAGFQENLASHLAAIHELRDTMKEHRDIMRQIRDYLTRK